MTTRQNSADGHSSEFGGHTQIDVASEPEIRKLAPLVSASFLHPPASRVDRRSRMLDIDYSLRRRCLEHLADVIDRAPLSTDPFPHFVVRGFFPADVYPAVLELLPDLASYRPFAYEKHCNPDGVSNRLHFGLSNGGLERLDPLRQPFWRTLRSVAGSTELKRLAFSKLAPGLALRYGVVQDEAAELPGFALPELFCESAGYAIRPHPDTRRKVVTMQIALPRDSRQRELGTEFYRRSFSPLALA